MPAFFDRIITVYGRKPALEVLGDDSLECYKLHLADSNRPAKIIDQLLDLAAKRGIPVETHSKLELSRISRKGSQDQGVAVDVLCPGFVALDEFLRRNSADHARLLAADGITNPQNVGMLIRSAVAGNIDGILWPASGNAALGPLAIKASAGTLLRAPLIRCGKLPGALRALQDMGYRVYVLDAAAETSLFDVPGTESAVFVLGNETDGPSPEIMALADRTLAIPMANGVESLNVAVTAALIAYLRSL